MIFFLQETLIVWSEADQYDLALSFQEKDGCDEIWEKICTVSVLTHSSHKFYLTSEYMIDPAQWHEIKLFNTYKEFLEKHI